MPLPTGYVVIGSAGLGTLVYFFALAYEMIRSSNDVQHLIHSLKKETDILIAKIRKPDLIQIDRSIKTSYKMLRSPQHKEENKHYFGEIIKYMLEIKKHMSPMDWIHAERANLRGLMQLRNDSVERLKGIQQYYKTR